MVARFDSLEWVEEMEIQGHAEQSMGDDDDDDDVDEYRIGSSR